MLTATLSSPQPAFKAPADATVRVELTRADIDLLLEALNTHQSHLCQTWEEVTARGGPAQLSQVSRLLGRVDQIGRTLLQASRI